MFTEFKIVIFKLIVENPECLFFLSTKKCRTGCKVKTGVELSDFCVLQYISLLLTLFQSYQMECICEDQAALNMGEVCNDNDRI